jgi:hypothetical protein
MRYSHASQEGQPTHHTRRHDTGRNAQRPEFVTGAYHQLFEIERSFRMAKSDLQARPIYHRKCDSIEAHLTIVFSP